MYSTPYLSTRQREIVQLIREAIAEHGEAPTVREIAARSGLAVGTVHYHLNQLEAKGVIARERWQPRGIRVW